MDRLAMSATCKGALQQVETYCEHVLQAIAGGNDCNVDESFHDRIRIRDQLGQQSTLLELPFRFLVQRAFKTHLSHISEGRIEEFVLSPSQTRLATRVQKSIVSMSLNYLQKIV